MREDNYGMYWHKIDIFLKATEKMLVNKLLFTMAAQMVLSMLIGALYVYYATIYLDT